MAPQRPRAAPTKRVLAALTAAVLLGHWLALGGRIPLWPSQWFKSRSDMGALPDLANVEAILPAQIDAPPEPAPEPALVTTSTVRWIAPPAPPPPPPPPPAPKPKPKPSPVVAEPEPLPPEPLELPSEFAAVVDPFAPLPADAPIPEVSEAAAPLAAQDAAPTDLAMAPKPTPKAPPEAVAESPQAAPALGPVLSQKNLPQSATLSYDVKGKAKGFNYSAGATLTWKQSGNAYSANLEISAFLLGTFQRISTGLITAQGLAPQRFVDIRRGKEKAAVFDREAGVIRYSKNTADAALLPGAQDQLSVMLQLSGLLNARQPATKGDIISVPVSSDSDAEVWQFEIGVVETLQLPAGEVTARRLVRLPRKPNDKTVEVWLATQLGRLPVRMRLTEPNGDFMDQLLEDLPEVAPAASPLALPNAGSSVP